MSILKNVGRNEFNISDNEVIIEEDKSRDGYEWREVTFKSGDTEIDMGSYFLFNYSHSTEWMEFNSRYIVFMAVYFMDSGELSEPKVKMMFDIKSKSFVSGSRDELEIIYNNNFGSIHKYTKKLVKQ